MKIHSTSSQNSPKHLWAVSIEDCCQWMLLHVQMTTLLFTCTVLYCSFHPPVVLWMSIWNVENTGEWTFTSERGGEDIFLYTCMDSVHFDLIVHSLMFFIAFWQDVISFGCGGDMMPEYKSMVYYHEGKPKWHETFKVSDCCCFFGGKVQQFSFGLSNWNESQAVLFS